jgi:23S rRNA G2069 N7-methylase RlmK/C1962 C5-methylase RlmI
MPRTDGQKPSLTTQTPSVAASGVPAPGAPSVGVPVDPRTAAQAQTFASRLQKLARHLRRLPTKQGITCFRIYERDIPEVPLVVDRYEDHLHLAEYDRPHDRDPAAHDAWLDQMAQTAADTLEVPIEKVFMKRRRRQVGLTQHEQVSQDRYELEVGEGGLRFIVNLSDYIDTGLFLDHRITRDMVRGVSAGKRFLNLFAYTGAFSVYAAAGGAAEVVTVDWSNTYLQWAQRNMRLNGFESPRHRFVRSDAVSFVADLPLAPQFDLAVVDPPTFSNSKRTEAVWDVQRDSAPLLRSLLARMSPGGVIYFSNNFRGFKMEPGELGPVASVHEISNQTVPPNYRNRKIHRCWRIVAKD